MFGRFGLPELALILVIALVVFGPKKLPEIGKALGNAIRNFKNSTNRASEEIEGSGEDEVQERGGRDSASREDADYGNTETR